MYIRTLAGPFLGAPLNEVNDQLSIVREGGLPLEFYRRLDIRQRGFSGIQDLRFKRKMVALEKLGDFRDEHAVLTLIAVVDNKLFAPRDFEPEQKLLLRQEAATALGKIGGTVALAKLNDLLQSKDPIERTMGSRGLSRASGGQAATSLLTALKTETDPNVKGELIFALGNIGGGLNNQAKELIVRELIRQIENNTHKELLLAAFATLGKLRLKSATEFLLKQLTKLHGDESLADTIVIALGNIGDERAVNLVVVMLEVHAKKRVRSSAALALGKIGGSKARDALKRRLNLEKEGSVRSDILRAMTPVIHQTFP